MKRIVSAKFVEAVKSDRVRGRKTSGGKDFARKPLVGALIGDCVRAEPSSKNRTCSNSVVNLFSINQKVFKTSHQQPSSTKIKEQLLLVLIWRR